MNWIRRYAGEMADNTCFMFISDHGDMQGDHHLWRKAVAYEGSSQIPFIVVPPDTRPAGRRVADEVVELRDVMPTILELAEVSCPPTVEGASVAPLLDAPGREWRPYLHGEHFGGPPDREMQYLTDGRRKFIWMPRTSVEQFFDLEIDPRELRNLIDDPGRLAEIGLWRDRLTQELEARQCGWTRNGRPYCPDDRPMISPWRDKRWPGRALS
jgi:arylsulfatase A-like enzyme